MTTIRAFKILFAMAFGASLPTLVALAYYAITGDPTARPLGISAAKLGQLQTPRDVLVINTVIITGTENSRTSIATDAEHLLARALAPYDVPFEILHASAPGRRVTVTFQIRDTFLGPYGLDRSAHGISAALAAYHLYSRAIERPTPTGRFLDP
jgi:hypothetical protein